MGKGEVNNLKDYRKNSKFNQKKVVKKNISKKDADR